MLVFWLSNVPVMCNLYLRDGSAQSAYVLPH